MLDCHPLVFPNVYLYWALWSKEVLIISKSSNKHKWIISSPLSVISCSFYSMYYTPFSIRAFCSPNIMIGMFCGNVPIPFWSCSWKSSHSCSGLLGSGAYVHTVFRRVLLLNWTNTMSDDMFWQCCISSFYLLYMDMVYRLKLSCCYSFFVLIHHSTIDYHVRVMLHKEFMAAFPWLLRCFNVQISLIISFHSLIVSCSLSFNVFMFQEATLGVLCYFQIFISFIA